MIKIIELTNAEAKKITSNKEGSDEWNKLSVEEQRLAQIKIDEQTINRSETFRDKDGNAYILLHGGHVKVDGHETGIIWYNKEPLIPDLVYEKVLETGFIKDGETLNVICCYGWYQQAKYHPMNFINNTKKGVATRTIVNNNGGVTLVIYTHDTVFERIAAELKCNAIRNNL